MTTKLVSLLRFGSELQNPYDNWLVPPSRIDGRGRKIASLVDDDKLIIKGWEGRGRKVWFVFYI